MFRFIVDSVKSAYRWVTSGFRKVTGIGSDNIPDVLTVFTVFTRVAVVALGMLALFATLVPSLSADPVAVRLLGASHSMWQAGTQAGYESRYGYNERGPRGLSGRTRPAHVSVFEMDEDDLPRRHEGWAG